MPVTHSFLEKFKESPNLRDIPSGSSVVLKSEHHKKVYKYLMKPIHEVIRDRLKACDIAADYIAFPINFFTHDGVVFLEYNLFSLPISRNDAKLEIYKFSKGVAEAITELHGKGFPTWV